MTEGDGRDAADGPDKSDLRFTEHQRHRVKVSRDLSGGGHLARGDKTNMSRLNFSARAKPRDEGERDSAFTQRPLEEAVPAAAAPKPPAPEPAAAAEAEAPADPPSLMERVGKIFGL